MAKTRTRWGDVGIWIVGSACCQALPIGCAFFATIVTEERTPILSFVGYSVILIVALGFFGAAVLDRIVDRHRRRKAQELFELAIGATLVVTIAFGMVRDSLDRVRDKTPTERQTATAALGPLWMQIGVAVPTMAYAIGLKSQLLRSRSGKR